MPTKRINVELLCSLVGFRDKCGHQGSQPRYCQGGNRGSPDQTRPRGGAEGFEGFYWLCHTPYSLCFIPSQLPTLQRGL